MFILFVFEVFVNQKVNKLFLLPVLTLALYTSPAKCLLFASLSTVCKKARSSPLLLPTMSCTVLWLLPTVIAMMTTPCDRSS